MEEAVELDDVRVVEEGVDLDLADDELLGIEPADLGLAEDLQGHDVVGLLLPRQEHVPEPPLAQLGAQLEVLYAELLEVDLWREGASGLRLGRPAFLVEAQLRWLRVAAYGVLAGLVRPLKSRWTLVLGRAVRRWASGVSGLLPALGLAGGLGPKLAAVAEPFLSLRLRVRRAWNDGVCGALPLACVCAFGLLLMGLGGVHADAAGLVNGGAFVDGMEVSGLLLEPRPALVRAWLRGLAIDGEGEARGVGGALLLRVLALVLGLGPRERDLVIGVLAEGVRRSLLILVELARPPHVGPAAGLEA